MADEDGIRTEEGQDKDKRSFSYMMEHPDEVQEPGAPPEKSEPSPDPKQEPAPGGEEETPEAKAAREAAETESAVKPPEFSPKHKTWEETETAREAAVNRMTVATTETGKEREAREAAEKRADAAEAKLAEQERVAAEAAKPKALTEDEQDAIFEKAAEEIAELDRTEPDYLKSYAKIWRRAVSKAGEHRSGPDTETLAEETANKAWEKIQAKQAAESAKTAEERQREDESRVESSARDMGTKAGLDLGNPDSADSIIWDRMKSKIPKEVFDKGTLEAQVEWVSAEVRKRTGKAVEQDAAERKQAAETQKRNTVMGKGVNFTPSKEIPKKTTLSEMY